MTRSDLGTTASGIDANLAAALAYAVGWVTGLAFYFFEPDNKFVRFHALQALFLYLVVAIGQQSAALFAFTLVMVYFTWGEIYSLFPATAADYFGTRNATSNYAVLYTAKGVASIIGGYVGALIFEQSGSWAMGFYGSAVMALVAAALAYGLRASQATAKAKTAKIPATA